MQVMYARQPWPSVGSSIPPWFRSSWDPALGRSGNTDQGERDEDPMDGGEEELDVEETDADASQEADDDLDRGLGEVCAILGSG
jgi:hypothetical protein